MTERTAPPVGMRLRSMREAKQMSLRTMADATKISTRTLEAVERGDLAKLPGGIYTRAVIRSYAACLGIDPDPVVAQFLAECPAHIEPAPRLEPDASEVAAARPAAAVRAFAARAWRPTLAAIPMLVALSFGYGTISWTLRPEPVLPSSSVDALALHGMSLAPVAPAVMRVAQLLGAGETDAAVAALTDAVLTLEIAPDAPCWVWLQIDGGASESRLLQAGERTFIEAERDVLLKVGDAGAVRLRINGQPARMLGEPGQVVTTRISTRNYPRYLGGES